MIHTSFPYSLALPRPFWNGYTDQGASTAKPVLNSTHWSPIFESSAGQIVSTPGDMRKYTKALGSGSMLGRATPQLPRLTLGFAAIAAGVKKAFGRTKIKMK